MSNTIRKKKLLIWLVNRILEYKDSNMELHKWKAEGFQDLVGYIKSGFFDTDGWISVKDRLPEEDGLYLVYTHHGRDVGRFEKDKLDNWYVFISDEFDNFHWVRGHVSHWMPLPEPPKGDDNG